jgi:hypothetical protein
LIVKYCDIQIKLTLGLASPKPYSGSRVLNEENIRDGRIFVLFA